MGLKVGLIGCGGMGTTHNLSLKAISTEMDIEVVALADCRSEFLEKAAVQWPHARKYEYGMELIEQETLDLVHICLPSYLHAQHAIAAMRKGMHTFIEKPVCLTEQDCKELLRAKEETGRKVMIGQVVRSFAEYRYLKQIYDEKTYGALKSIMMQRVSGDAVWGFEDWFHDEKRSGSVVLDLHVHDLDFLRYMLGEPDSMDVRATEFEGGLVNQVVTQYEFGKVFATVEGVWDVSPALPFEASFRACFEKGTVVFKGSQKPSVMVYLADGTSFAPELKEEYEKEDHSAGINISNLGPYYTEIKYFIDCLMHDKEPVIAPLEEGVKSVALARHELSLAKEYIQKMR